MKFKFNNLIAFTLSEMMIVLLIVSVISAATIPTITQKKQKPYQTSDSAVVTDGLWQSDRFGGIFTNFSKDDKTQTVVVGKDTKNFTADTKNRYRKAFAVSYTPTYADVALILHKDQNTLTNNDDRGQAIFYESGRYVGSLSMGKRENILLGTNVMTQTQGTGNLMQYSIMMGYYAGYGNYNSGIPGWNVVIGEYAMANQAMVETSIIAIGKYAAYHSTFENSNISIGECASSNVCYGPAKYAHNSATPSAWNIPTSWNIAIGSMAGRLGYIPVTSNDGAQNVKNNISIGYYSGNYGYGQKGDYGRDMQMDNIAIGVYSGLNNHYANTVNIGYFAGGSVASASAGYTAIKENNINIGNYAGANDDIGSYFAGVTLSSVGQNINIGNYAGFSRIGLSRSLFAGSFAGANSIGYTGSAYRDISSSTGLGYYAMYASQSSNVTAIGAYAGYNSTSSMNLYIGRRAGFSNKGNSNIFIGYAAGAESNLTDTIAIGFEAGKGAKSTSGTWYNYNKNNVFIGYGAGHFGSTVINGNNKYVILPYSSSSIYSDTKQFQDYSLRPQMIIGPGYGYPGGPSFNNTIMMLYAGKVYTRQSNMTVFVSDKRAKENIVPSKYGINVIRHLNTYTFNFKSDKTKILQVGLIAQEVQKYIPEAIKTNVYTGKLMIDFDWILFPVANAIKDVDTTLTAIQKDLIAQAKDLISLEKRVDKLDRKVSKNLGKQEKIQAKLDKAKDIVNNMETK